MQFKTKSRIGGSILYKILFLSMCQYKNIYKILFLSMCPYEKFTKSFSYSCNPYVNLNSIPIQSRWSQNLNAGACRTLMSNNGQILHVKHFCVTLSGPITFEAIQPPLRPILKMGILGQIGNKSQ